MISKSSQPNQPSPPKDLSEINATYGGILFSSELGLHWPKAPDYIKPLSVPDAIKLTYAGKPVYRIFCNKDVHAPLSAVFSALVGKNLHYELKTFDGCFNVRWVRGVPGVASIHSWGLAFDFNAQDNHLGGESKWTAEFIAVWESHGFTWGGRFTRKDPMHFQWCRI